MYDVTIIGAGVSSVFLAYTLMKKNEHLRIHIIDKGKELKDRLCSIEKENGCTCSGECDQYIGFAGLGKSEGKFNYTNAFGGELARKVGDSEAMELMDEVDHILTDFGGSDRPKYSTHNESLVERAKPFDLNILSTEVRHLGTVLAKRIFERMYQYMKEHIDFTFQTDVQHIYQSNHSFTIHTNKGVFTTYKLVLATGKSGGDWLDKQATALGIQQGETRLDMGVRVELEGNQFQPILDNTFETKLQYEKGEYTATTYCMNPGGRIIRKYQHGLVMPDGQNAKEKASPSPNVNFTLFVPQYFSSVKQAHTYARNVVGEINQGSDRIVVQRLGDLLVSKKTESLSTNAIIPTLTAHPGNLLTEIPRLYIDMLLDFIHAVEGLIGERWKEDTLLYGLDTKFYEPAYTTNDYFETEVPGLFLAGDCSGETHSLSQAAASGIHIGRHLASG
ncbi:NAD(P)/FAD-dependent oxidoreductase [Pontibacillus salicampi]|uniref:NAD(P)/FAD-dependent oxidoreductase n=1 Tax=Pontibacillus salicampi TaxID=1449801 RepID=A0ABV6LLK2_9BACI